MKSLLRQGGNVIAVKAVNGGASAGLLFRLLDAVSDQATICSTDATDGWEAPDFGAFTWQPAMELGEVGMAPWGKLAGRATV